MGMRRPSLLALRPERKDLCEARRFRGRETREALLESDCGSLGSMGVGGAMGCEGCVVVSEVSVMPARRWRVSMMCCAS